MPTTTMKLAPTLAVLLAAPLAFAGFTLKEMSPQSTACVACHKKESAAIYEQWGSSKHFRANVGCYECHMANQTDSDAYEHYGQFISTIASPRDCARCHEREVQEFNDSHHAKGARILGSLDNTLAEVVEGNRAFKTTAFPHGVSAAAVNGCWQCHGSEVKVLPTGRLDPATWPNTGIGRINPDGSEGSCTACHSRHSFSAAQARTPDTCGKCHMGPDHPQIEIYNESKHGIAYYANIARMNLDNPKWIVGEDYSAAPTCATCHMSATKDQPVTHDVGMRISWNNRPELSIRPEVGDAKLGLPGANISWEKRRANMQNVCINCHNANYVGAFYQQYDALIDLYHGKFAEPGLALYKAARPLLPRPQFANKVDFTWYEIWHHEGRRARHGASMMGPDYTHWHGTYEVAKHFYSKYIPELQELVEKNINSTDPEKKQQAEALNKLIEDTLNHDNHKWYLGKMDPEEKARREQQLKEFQKRYAK
ncbi:MAG: ammonia-forming cytochrome c nitrite reductase subunit c552 [Verrucomicrobiae bacterium]|nr:ammonia-forming cytochrome c nitrite reductase subunit c552 [Verrucomicrobiae bacterium]